MPNAEQAEVKLPIGLLWKGTWYDTAIVREMLGGDNQALVSPNARQNYVKGLTLFLSKVILAFRNSKTDEVLDKVTEDVIREMYTADRDMCSIETRRLALGEIVPVKIKCEYCGDAIEAEISLNDIEPKMAASFPPDENLTFDLELKRGFTAVNRETREDEDYKHVTMTHLKGKDQEKMVTDARTNSEKAAVTGILCAIKEIHGLGDRKNALMVENLKRIDYDAIQKAIGENRLGPNLDVSITCGGCDAESQVPLGLAMFRSGE